MSSQGRKDASGPKGFDANQPMDACRSGSATVSDSLSEDGS